MAPTRDAHCSYCGTAFAETRAYPRTCTNPACGAQVWANPIPVSVVLTPVRAGERTGLLVVRRAGHSPSTAADPASLEALVQAQEAPLLPVQRELEQAVETALAGPAQRMQTETQLGALQKVRCCSQRLALQTHWGLMLQPLALQRCSELQQSTACSRPAVQREQSLLPV